MAANEHKSWYWIVQGFGLVWHSLHGICCCYCSSKLDANAKNLNWKDRKWHTTKLKKRLRYAWNQILMTFLFHLQNSTEIGVFGGRRGLWWSNGGLAARKERLSSVRFAGNLKSQRILLWPSCRYVVVRRYSLHNARWTVRIDFYIFAFTQLKRELTFFSCNSKWLLYNNCFEGSFSFATRLTEFVWEIIKNIISFLNFRK